MYMIIDITPFCHINWEVVAFKLFVLETILSGSSLQAQGPFWHFVKVFELYLNHLKRYTRQRSFLLVGQCCNAGRGFELLASC